MFVSAAMIEHFIQSIYPVNLLNCRINCFFRKILINKARVGSEGKDIPLFGKSVQSPAWVAGS